MPGKAKAAIARFVSLHPHNLAQKAEVIVEHFRAHTATKIAGRAKAMVVTSSRLHAVRYKQAIDRYIAEKGYPDIHALVAFSGTVVDEGLEFTEPNMNRFAESQTAQQFNDGDYQVMVVAEKFQTGYDQPLLHTMFVDKPLQGLYAVQTLSRLNRIYPEKTDTFVLDYPVDHWARFDALSVTAPAVAMASRHANQAACLAGHGCMLTDEIVTAAAGWYSQVLQPMLEPSRDDHEPARRERGDAGLPVGHALVAR